VLSASVATDQHADASASGSTTHAPAAVVLAGAEVDDTGHGTPAGREEWGVEAEATDGGMDHGGMDHGGGMMSEEDMQALMNASGADFDRCSFSR
jgi:hypothetical protein